MRSPALVLWGALRVECWLCRRLRWALSPDAELTSRILLVLAVALV